MGNREKKVLPVQYTFIGHYVQVLELLVHIGIEVTEGGDLYSLFAVHCMGVLRDDLPGS